MAVPSISSDTIPTSKDNSTALSALTGYPGFLNRVAMPAYNKLRGRQYAKIRFFLEESQWWTPQQLAEFQFGELQKLLKVAFESIPFYQKKYAEAGVRFSDIKDLSDLKKLPPLERNELRNNLAELRNPVYPGKLISHATGGSSGSPTRFFMTMESYEWRTAATERAYASMDAILGERIGFLWGAPSGELTRAKKLHYQIYEGYRRHLKINTFIQPDGFWEDALKKLIDFQPAALVAYTTNIEQICRVALKVGVKIKSLKSVISASEQMYPKLHETVREALGVPLFNTYGSREFMSIAVECKEHKGLHINSENILLENNPDATFSNELLVTDLHNFGTPFIRYKIGDSAPIDYSPCACGRGLHRLGTIDGRVMDLLRTKDGRLVPGILIPHTMKELPEVIQFQAEQVALDKIILRLVLSAELSDESKRMLSSEMQKAFGTETTFAIERVAEIPKLASGKQRSVIGLNAA